MTLNEVGQQAHLIAVQHGFYDEEVNVTPPSTACVLASLCRIHTKLCELIARHAKPGVPTANIEEAIADTVIELADLSAYLDNDLDRTVRLALAYKATQRFT